MPAGGLINFVRFILRQSVARLAAFTLLGKGWVRSRFSACGLARVLDEGMDFGKVFDTGAGFDAGGDIDG